MGSSSSASLPMTALPCGLIKVCSWKGDTRDRVLMVPVAQEVFQYSYQHPLFQLLHSTRNEPSVRHWYAGGCTVEGVAEDDRATRLEPEISAQDYYAELFLRPTAGSATSPAHGTEERTTRWMMISLPLATASGNDQSEILESYLQGTSNGCFLTLKEAVDIVTLCKSSVHAAGYLECHHGETLSTLRYWMAKSFATEGRSLILSEAVAFMEVRRMQLANLRAVSPSAMELEVRVGDVSTLRTLEWTIRKLLPTNLSAHHQFITIAPVSTAGCGNLQVRVNLPALTEILQSLEGAVQYPVTSSSSNSSDDESSVNSSVRTLNRPTNTTNVTPSSASKWLSLTFDQRPIERVPTPFSPFVETARAIWQQQNVVVVAVQPNQRKEKKSRRARDDLNQNGNTSNSDSESSPKTATSPNVTATTSRRNSGGSQVEPRPNDGNAIVPGPQQQNLQPYQGRPSPVQQQPLAAAHQPYQMFFPPHPSAVPVPRVELYELADNTPVHYYQPQSGCWLPLWYLTRGGARLVLSADQPYQAEGKVLLETQDPLTLIDENEQVYTTPGAPAGNKNLLVVMRQA